MLIGVDYMNWTDQRVLSHLQSSSTGDAVHVVYGQVADKLECGRNTAYRSIKRLRSAGYLEIIAGNNRTGYTYRIRNGRN